MKETAADSLARCPTLASDDAPDTEVAELFLPFLEGDDQRKVRDVDERQKPFAAFGSYRQRHGDAVEHNCMRTIEAPAKLESVGSSRTGGLFRAFSYREEGNGCLESEMAPSDRLAVPWTRQFSACHCKAFHKGKSFSTDLDREEAWERKKEQYLPEEDGDCDDDNDYGDYDDEEEYGADKGAYDESCEKGAGAESPSENDDDDTFQRDAKGSLNLHHEHGDGSRDADSILLQKAHGDEDHLDDERVKKGSRRMPISRKKSPMRRHMKPAMRTRTKSLTDEDMEELRGSIDLGFGFSYTERCNLKRTLPALELYFAINKSYADAQSRSPISPLDGNALVRTNSAGSNASSSSREAWRISSPGDHPSQVKTRLRHWAQAVACSVKQGCVNR